MDTNAAPAEDVGVGPADRDSAVGLDSIDAGVRILTRPEASIGWKSFRQYNGADSIEVFVSPSDHWYIRAERGQRADLIAPSGTPGIRPSRLSKIDHWKPVPEQQVSNPVGS